MKEFFEWCLSVENKWLISPVLFITTCVAAILFAFFKYRKKSVLTSNRILFVGIFVSAVAFFMPIYMVELTKFQAVLNSVQHAFRLFALEGDFIEKVVKYGNYPAEVKEFYISYGAVLYTFAPILTFGFILSFFKNLSAHLKYNICFWAKAHIFSDLNAKSIAFATDLKNNKKHILGFIPRVLIVFTDVVDKNEEQSLELIEDAKELGAILFRKDLESVRFKRSWSPRRVNFYLISEDESEKIRHAEKIMANYDYKNVELRVFSDDVRTELMLAAKAPENMEIERINVIQSLVYHNLYVNGINLFERARENVISAVIVGLGKYGQEMMKALTWYCQMEKYKLKINVFDADEKAKEKFEAMCPELMKLNRNEKSENEEAYYEIDIHSAVDVSVPAFEEELKKINDATYFFVCLGNDVKNLEVSAKIREICERIDYTGDGHKPDIETVIYDSNIKETMGITWKDVREIQKSENEGKKHIRGVVNYKSQPYNILMTGDLKYFYSEEMVINSELVEAGRAIHVSYSTEYEKLRITQNLMKKEFDEFITANGLTVAWKKSQNESKELSDAISSFSFMTAEEQEQYENASDKETIRNLKDIATQRIDDWEKKVYSKFDELMKNPKISRVWEKVQKKAILDANKTFRFEYNYRSSIAKAIHKKLRSSEKFRTELTDKPWRELTVEEKVRIGATEHIRWNAYMRAEGYSFAEKRNDLAKNHPNLVPVSELTNDDLRKDA